MNAAKACLPGTSFCFLKFSFDTLYLHVSVGNGYVLVRITGLNVLWFDLKYLEVEDHCICLPPLSADVQSTKDCVLYYYRSKKTEKYKRLLRKYSKRVRQQQRQQMQQQQEQERQLQVLEKQRQQQLLEEQQRSQDAGQIDLTRWKSIGIILLLFFMCVKCWFAFACFGRFMQLWRQVW